jgi:hypothetical protein
MFYAARGVFGRRGTHLMLACGRVCRPQTGWQHGCQAVPKRHVRNDRNCFGYCTGSTNMS